MLAQYRARLPALETLWHRLRAGASECLGFVQHVARSFMRDGCLDSAGTLAYTTLLSIVPVFALVFTVLTAFPVFEDFSAGIQDWLFANLVPASGEVVQDYMQEFAGRAAGLTAMGIIGIAVAAILMMAAIDKAMNRIWRVVKRRPAVHSFMVYWTVITVGPFLVAGSLALSSYLMALAEFAALAEVGTLQRVLLAVAPFIGIVLAFTFLYAAVPNRRVPIRHAIAGAVFAAVLFEVAKRGFAGFITAVPTYEAIYGALAALPIFLIWIFVCWIVVLLGAEFTKALGSYRSDRAGSLSEARLALVVAVRIIGDLWRAQQQGLGLSRQEIQECEPDASEAALDEALSALEQARVLRRSEDGSWLLIRDPSECTLLDLYQAYPFVLADVPERLRGRDAWNRALAATLREAIALVEVSLDRSLRDVLAAPADDVAPEQARDAADVRRQRAV